MNIEFDVTLQCNFSCLNCNRHSNFNNLKAHSDKEKSVGLNLYENTDVTLDAVDKFIEDGVLVAGDPLESVNTSTTLRVRGGNLETTDGPFAETKEQLGGYYIFECDNLDDALKYAAMIPSVKHGSIEVRPIMTIVE